ncbi:hypothetical protein CHARACLAT_009581 [Characodon lateralis]|uniref:Uncharacterized protein n=1 Tax=Characodon lateralis TaxID=208331 RepID=A0ABU7F1X6_9TELE|nr:hypothetical protein [Characodon lateralis]
MTSPKYIFLDIYKTSFNLLCSMSTVRCHFASSLHVGMGTLTKHHCVIFKGLPNIKGSWWWQVVFWKKKISLWFHSGLTERELRQVVKPFNVARLLICACGSKPGQSLH